MNFWHLALCGEDATEFGDTPPPHPSLYQLLCNCTSCNPAFWLCIVWRLCFSSCNKADLKNQLTSKTLHQPQSNNWPCLAWVSISGCRRRHPTRFSPTLSFPCPANQKTTLKHKTKWLNSYQYLALHIWCRHDISNSHKEERKNPVCFSVHGGAKDPGKLLFVTHSVLIISYPLCTYQL